MKKLEISQMENLQGGKGKCSEDNFMTMLGAGVVLTVVTGGVGAWITAGALYGCVIANS